MNIRGFKPGALHAIIMVLCLQLALPGGARSARAAEPTTAVTPAPSVPADDMSNAPPPANAATADPSLTPATPEEENAKLVAENAQLKKEKEELEKRRAKLEKQKKMLTIGLIAFGAIALIAFMMEKGKGAKGANSKNCEKGAGGSSKGCGAPGSVAGASNPRANDSRFNEKQWPPTRGNETVENLVKKQMQMGWLRMPAAGPAEAEGIPAVGLGLKCSASGASDAVFPDLKGKYAGAKTPQEVRTYLNADIPKMACGKHRDLMNKGLTDLDAVSQKHQGDDIATDSEAVNKQAQTLVNALSESDSKGLEEGSYRADFSKAESDVVATIESEKIREKLRGQAGDSVARAIDDGPGKVYSEAHSASATQKGNYNEDGKLVAAPDEKQQSDSTGWEKWSTSDGFKVVAEAESRKVTFASYNSEGQTARNEFGQAIKGSMDCTIGETHWNKDWVVFNKDMFTVKLGNDATKEVKTQADQMKDHLNKVLLPAAKKFFANRMARAIQHTFQAAAIETGFLAGHAVGFYELQNQSVETMRKLDADRIKITESQNALRAPAGAVVESFP